MRNRLLCVGVCLLAASAAGDDGSVPVTARTLIPADAAMSKADTAWQRMLLPGCKQPGAIQPGGYRLKNPRVVVAPAEAAAKLGRRALALEGEAIEAGSKGDFVVAQGVHGTCRWLGLWVYLGRDPNVGEVGLQVYDQEGECFIKLVPANWTGWKWVELETTAEAMRQAYPQPDKNRKIDGSLKGVNVAWFAKQAGPTAIVVDGLVAVTSLPAGAAPRPVEAALAAADRLEPGERMAAQLVLTNYEDAPARVQGGLLAAGRRRDVPARAAGPGVRLGSRAGHAELDRGRRQDRRGRLAHRRQGLHRRRHALGPRSLRRGLPVRRSRPGAEDHAHQLPLGRRQSHVEDRRGRVARRQDLRGRARAAGFRWIQEVGHHRLAVASAGGSPVRSPALPPGRAEGVGHPHAVPLERVRRPGRRIVGPAGRGRGRGGRPGGG